MPSLSVETFSSFLFFPYNFCVGCSLAISLLLFFLRRQETKQLEGGGKVEGSSFYLPLYSLRDQVCDSLLSETPGLVLLPDFLF